MLTAIGMALVYLAGCFTPLHLHFDSIRYYDIKDCIEFGCPPDSFAATDFLPYGYTFLLVGLSKLGILSAFSIVLVNCIYLFGTVFFISRIFGRRVHPYLYALILLFHWLMIKFTVHPLSELQYIFFSSASLYCFHQYLQRKSFLFLGLAVVFSLFTVLTRTVGIALLPALVLGALWHHRKQLIPIIQKHKFKLILGGVVLLAGMYFSATQLKVTSYTSSLKENYAGGSRLQLFIDNLLLHFRELGEVLINMPAGKLLDFLPGTAGIALFVVLGLLFLGWITWVCISRKAGIPVYIKLYLLFYAFIILNWPYYDPRFWAPLVPLFAAILLCTPWPRPVFRSLAKVYIGFYLLVGAAAAVYSLKLGFNKAEFAGKHAAGVYRNEYETHFFGKPLSDTATHVDAHIVDLLNKYD